MAHPPTSPPHQPCHSMFPINTETRMHISPRSEVSPPSYGKPFLCLCLVSQAWLKILNNKRCLPWPHRNPFFIKKRKKNGVKKGFCLTLQPSSPSSSFLCVLPQSVLSTYCAQLPRHSREPPLPFPNPPTHPPITMPALKRLVGLSYWVELDMVNVALAGPNCPEDTS